MKKISTIISAASLAVSVLGAVPLTAGAEESENLIYGTMNIPYADFYANEGIGYDVDAVSSATTSKWSSNQDGGLVQGTFNEGNDDGTGRILGVVYPVAISQENLDALGENNYSFTSLDSVPEAYKEVTLSDDGSVSFSSVVDNEVETALTSLTVETASVWGDYCVTVDELSYERGAAASSIGKLYGCIVTDTDGNSYAMRHLENIWKNELGINVLEGSDIHGAPLSYANFTGLNGATIDTVKYITEKGYYIYDVDPDAYLAKKVTGTVSIADADISAGQTMLTSDLPSDYDAEYTLEGINGSVNDGVIIYSDALAGTYSVTVSDKNNIYESFAITFSLTSDSMPASYSDGSVVKAEGADDADFANFLKNISVVSVNGTDYSASGRGSVQIIGEDGKIDVNAASRSSNIFDGNGIYQIVVKSAGYNNSLAFDFVIGESEQPSTEENTNINNSGQNSSNTNSNNSSNNSNNSSNSTSKSSNSSSSSTSSPKTGVAGVAVPVTLMAVAVLTAFAVKKKNK
ncbi:MAG: NPXTG-anchored protein [Ruminococcus sp.]|nr:NPXTG-anchored protein [Ruminococcus sp.]MDE6847906.1 NPXTG-anchored protein [Ruminococcus sp.]MDE7137701.1 NPXTG-anchored protein [Ruminococcus sp.]